MGAEDGGWSKIEKDLARAIAATANWPMADRNARKNMPERALSMSATYITPWRKRQTTQVTKRRAQDSVASALATCAVSTGRGKHASAFKRILAGGGTGTLAFQLGDLPRGCLLSTEPNCFGAFSK